jgi:hypothetical protein
VNVSERQISEWEQSPVTELFFKRIEERASALESADFLTRDSDASFSAGWELSGGASELRMLINTDKAVILEGVEDE